MPRKDSPWAAGDLDVVLEAQHQVISAAQARAGGMTEEQIRWKVKSGRWQCLYRGTYATFSGRLSREAQLWAAVLRAGAHSWASRDSLPLNVA